MPSSDLTDYVLGQSTGLELCQSVGLDPGIVESVSVVLEPGKMTCLVFKVRAPQDVVSHNWKVKK